LRTVFLGTSDFAAAILRSLAAGSHRPRLVVTPPDRRRGRGRSLSPPPAAEVAAELGIPLHQTADASTPGSVAAIAAVEAEAGVVCAFGQLIREPLLNEPPMLNVHPSLLPRWRGAAPIERAIMAGDAVTGVCVMRLTAGLDSGPVALSESTPIAAEDDYGSLASRLAAIGGGLIGSALDLQAEGLLELTEQDEDGATYADKLDRADRRVNVSGDAMAESRRIRALTPHIGAYVELAGGSRLGLRDPRPLESGPSAGVIEASAVAEELIVGCATGALAIAAVQPPGKRWMAAGDFLRGHGLPEGARAG